jgi:hypothetical protein
MKTKVKNIGKKIVSLLLLSVGLLYLESGVFAPLLIYYVSSTSSAKLNLSAIIFPGDSLFDIVIPRRPLRGV